MPLKNFKSLKYIKPKIIEKINFFDFICIKYSFFNYNIKEYEKRSFKQS